MAKEKRGERLLDLGRRFGNGERLTINRICSDYEVDRRTVQRDLIAIRDKQAQLQSDIMVDGSKIWSIAVRHRKIDVSYNLTDLTALFMGRRLFDFLQGTLLEESLNKVYESIDRALEWKKNYLNAPKLAKKVHLISEGPKQLAPEHVDCLDSCLTALLDEKLLDIIYVNAQGKRGEHHVEPLTLVAFRRGLYLLARYPDTGAFRIFALERVKKAEWLRGSTFTYPADFDPYEYFKSALFMRPGEPQKTVLLFTKSTEPFIRIRKFHDSQKTKRKRDGSVEMTLQVPITDELVYWILSFGSNVKVKEPDRLIALVKDEAMRTWKQYGGK